MDDCVLFLTPKPVFWDIELFKIIHQLKINYKSTSLFPSSTISKLSPRATPFNYIEHSRTLFQVIISNTNHAIFTLYAMLQYRSWLL